IHYASPRKRNAFFPVNSAAIPEHLLESEFFGHKKGAFTGATENKKGCFELACGGTLFLDEIADMPLSLQSRSCCALWKKKELSR
ncbi:MAG: two-component system response regulator, partial [Candidatus Cloacimonas sp. 4484_143]